LADIATKVLSLRGTITGRLSSSSKSRWRIERFPSPAWKTFDAGGRRPGIG
jgi:hypothetical protein